MIEFEKQVERTIFTIATKIARKIYPWKQVFLQSVEVLTSDLHPTHLTADLVQLLVQNIYARSLGVNMHLSNKTGHIICILDVA